MPELNICQRAFGLIAGITGQLTVPNVVRPTEGLRNDVLNFQFVVSVLVPAINALALLIVEQLPLVLRFLIIFQQCRTLGKRVRLCGAYRRVLSGLAADFGDAVRVDRFFVLDFLLHSRHKGYFASLYAPHWGHSLMVPSWPCCQCSRHKK